MEIDKDLDYSRCVKLSLSNGHEVDIIEGTYKEMNLKGKMETFLAVDRWTGETVVGSTGNVIAMWFKAPSTNE